MGTIQRSAGTPLASHLQSLPYRLLSSNRSVMGGVLAAVVRLMVTWEQRLRDRDTLRAMGPAQLGDIGLDPAEVWREADKPFWRA